MKKITDEYFKKFCNVIKRSLLDSSKFQDCLSNMVNASEDDNHNESVYKDSKMDMEIIKLDEYTKDFRKKRQEETSEIKDHQPASVDAVCVNKENEWFLIEFKFKNEPLGNVLRSTPKKMLGSLWLIAFLYSQLSEQIADELDFLKFAREHVTFITVVSSEKNEEYSEAIGATWEKEGSFYTPEKFQKYKGYYFKDVYILTEVGLNAYKQSPASKSKRRRWGYGGMLMSGGGKAPSDKLRSSMRS